MSDLAVSSSCDVESWRLAAHDDVGSHAAAFASPSSPCGVERERWAARVVVAHPTAELAPRRRRVVSNVPVGLHVSLWATLPQRCPPVVIMWCRTSVLSLSSYGLETPPRHRRTPALGYPCHCGLPFCGGRPIIVVWCRWSAHIVVGCHAAAFPHRRHRVVLDLGVVMGLAERGLEALATATGKRKGRQWATTKVVARFRDVPAGHFPPIAPPSVFSSVERHRNGPTSLRRGEGHLWIGGRGWEPAGAMGVEGGGRRRRKMKPTSTVDAVDDGFKLRSHAQ